MIPPADAGGALPLALGVAPDKGANGSAVAVLTGFVAGALFGYAAVDTLFGLATTDLDAAGLVTTGLSGTM